MRNALSSQQGRKSALPRYHLVSWRSARQALLHAR